MPHLNADALTSDTEGLAFLRGVLETQPQAAGEPFKPAFEQRPTPPVRFEQRDIAACLEKSDHGSGATELAYSA
jgi:hypothetical protein